MKNTILLILMILGTGWMCGCKKVLDLNPENSLTFRNALVTTNDFEAVLRGVGQLTMRMNYINFSMQESKGEYADEMHSISEMWRSLSPQNIQTDFWVRYYIIIAQANIVLHFADNANIPSNRKDIYKGQALFYKALSYFELIRHFGDCILMKDELEIEPKAKAHWTEVADYAIELAENAAVLLPEFDRMPGDGDNARARYKSTPAKGAANALLAHLCAWKAGGKYFAVDQSYDDQAMWARAERAASSVIESGSYSLAANPEEVVTSVLVGDSRESVYETVFKGLWHELQEGDEQSWFTLANHYISWPVVPNSSPTDIQTIEGFRIYNASVETMFPGGDLRKNAYFYDFDTWSHPDSVHITGGFAYPYKWRKLLIETEGWNAGNMLNIDANRIWWRLADIMLLRAECRARLQDHSGAISDLNIVRTRANASLYDPSEHGGDLRFTIYKEREKELLMEGHRYFDIIRNGYASIELLGNFKTASPQDFKDGAFFLALDRNEFATNSLVRQNIYWSRFL